MFAFFQLKDNPELQNPRGHSATGLRNTIILLLLFQILRIISLKIQKQELVAPTRGSATDLFDERKITFTDFFLFTIYFVATIILNV